jgi:polysaccharide pyruvyl transferase WcaK-like protein
LVTSEKPSDIVWDWADLNHGFKAWLSVGVRPFENINNAAKINKTLEDLDYVSVRGIISKKILEHDQVNFYNPKITITPDLGWLFPKFLNIKNEIAKHYKKYIPAEKYVIFQTNTITSEEAGLIGEALVKFELYSGLKVLLLPVIHPWEDEKYLRMIEASTNGSISMLPETLSTLEIADILVHAEIVLSSSLHSAITALAHGIPAAIINKWQGTKLQDLFGLQFRVEYLSNDFNNTYDLLVRLISEKKRNEVSLHLYADFMKEKLSEVFDELCKNILTKSKHNI